MLTSTKLKQISHPVLHKQLKGWFIFVFQIPHSKASLRPELPAKVIVITIL